MRSFAHMSNERLDPDNERWVLEVLIPKLNSETGLTWSLGTQFSDKTTPNNLLVSDKCFMQIPYTMLDLDDEPPPFNLQNTSIKTIQKLYPGLKDENIGYYIIDKKDYSRNGTRKWPKEVRDYNLCWGYWALDLNPILERGKTMAKRFGI